MSELTATDRSCGRAQEAAPPLYPSGSSDTLPAHTQVVSDWTDVQPSMLPDAKARKTPVSMSTLGPHCHGRMGGGQSPWFPWHSSVMFPSTWPSPGLLQTSWPERSLHFTSKTMTRSQHAAAIVAAIIYSEAHHLPLDCWHHFCWQRQCPHSPAGALIRILVNLENKR